jgi:hypothetical protein
VGRWWRQPPPRGVQERRRARGHPQNAVAPIWFCEKRDNMRSISDSLSRFLSLVRSSSFSHPSNVPQGEGDGDAGGLMTRETRDAERRSPARESDVAAESSR